MQNNGKCNYITHIALLHCEICRPIAMYTHNTHICYYYTGCSHRHTKPILKWLETSSACSHQKRFDVNQFRPNSLRDVSWNWFGYRVKAAQKSRTIWQLFRQPGWTLKQNDDFYHGVILHLPTSPKRVHCLGTQLASMWSHTTAFTWTMWMRAVPWNRLRWTDSAKPVRKRFQYEYPDNVTNLLCHTLAYTHACTKLLCIHNSYDTMHLPPFSASEVISPLEKVLGFAIKEICQRGGR